MPSVPPYNAVLLTIKVIRLVRACPTHRRGVSRRLAFQRRDSFGNKAPQHVVGWSMMLLIFLFLFLVFMNASRTNIGTLMDESASVGARSR